MANQGAKSVAGSCCGGGGCDAACSCRESGSIGDCRVESVVSLDGRGQMVLPKPVRDRAGFRSGDRLAVVSWEREGRVCCISLQKADDLAEVVRRTYGPLLSR
jgi:antitoxin PrlF